MFYAAWQDKFFVREIMGRKKKKQKQINTPEFLGRGVTYVFLVLMMGIFPIYYPGHLIGIHEVKAAFFTVVGSVYLCMIFVPVLNRLILAKKNHQKIEWNICDALVAAFLVSVIFSTVFALNKETAFYGNSRMKTGADILLLCIGSYYAVRMFAVHGEALLKFNLLASTFIYLSGILITCKTDILNMQKNIIEEQKEIFVSPLGNINYNVAYISLILPAVMALFLCCRTAKPKRMLAAYLYIAFTDILCLRAESAVAMLAFAFVLLFYFALERADWLGRYFLVVQLFLGANITVFLLKAVLGDHMYGFDGIHALLLRPEMVVFEIAAAGLLFWIQKKLAAVKDGNMAFWQKLYGISMVSLFALLVLFVIGINLFFRAGAQETFLNAIVLQDTTGNLRGYVWSRTVGLFAKLPIPNQLFGCGLGCFYDFLYPTYGEDMLARFNSVFYDPHNDFLQVLVTTGIVGVIGFFGAIFVTIRRAAVMRKTYAVHMMTIMSMACFLLQGLVNSYTIFAIPLVFIVLGLAYTPPAEE